MNEKVVFYQLTQKFVNTQVGIPENARQVIYYSLAIGHHVGVMDCFKSLIEIPLEEYRCWIDQLPEGAGRHKLEGVLKWGEIELNHTHAGKLLSAINPSLTENEAPRAEWIGSLVDCLEKMLAEPALYLMVRKFA